MTKEEKDLIFQEICERLPYRPLVKDIYYNLRPVPVWLVDSSKQEVRLFADEDWTSVENVRLYLRPLTSMTEEEKAELFQLMGNGNDIQRVEFYDSHHLDKRGLIYKGLALEASTEIYEEY